MVIKALSVSINYYIKWPVNSWVFVLSTIKIKRPKSFRKTQNSKRIICFYHFNRKDDFKKRFYLGVAVPVQQARYACPCHVDGAPLVRFEPSLHRPCRPNDGVTSGSTPPHAARHRSVHYIMILSSRRLF